MQSLRRSGACNPIYSSSGASPFEAHDESTLMEELGSTLVEEGDEEEEEEEDSFYFREQQQKDFDYAEVVVELEKSKIRMDLHEPKGETTSTRWFPSASSAPAAVLSPRKIRSRVQWESADEIVEMRDERDSNDIKDIKDRLRSFGVVVCAENLLIDICVWLRETSIRYVTTCSG